MATGSNVQACTHDDIYIYIYIYIYERMCLLPNRTTGNKSTEKTLAQHRAAAGSAPAREANDHAQAYLTTAISQVRVLMVQTWKHFHHGCTRHIHLTVKKVLYSLQQYAKSKRKARCILPYQMINF
jgi:sarcosine oxidase delta subunit